MSFGALKRRRKLPNQDRMKCKGKGEEDLAGLVILAPVPEADRGETPQAADTWQLGHCLSGTDLCLSCPSFSVGAKPLSQHTLSRTALPALACQGCWWDPSSDAAPVGVQCGPAAFPNLGAGSFPWFWIREEGGNERLGSSAAAEQSFEGAGGHAGWSEAGREAELSTTSSAAWHSRGQRPQLPAAADDSKCEVWD